MSVYKNENPSFLKKSIESMLLQTIKPSQFVIVCDGPLGPDLDDVIDQYSQNPVFKFVRLKQNCGLSYALNIGIKECSFEYILRMDSDDISLPNRAESELHLLLNGYDIVGSCIGEFVSSPDDIIGYRSVPLEHEKIVKFSKKRTPFNHPSVAFKKSIVLASGNYSPETRYMQDYYLWVRCIQYGAKCANTDQVLVNMRSGQTMRLRRSGKEFVKSYKTVFRYMLKTKYITFFRYATNVLSFFIYSHLGKNTKEFLVYKWLRKKKVKTNDKTKN